MNLVEEKIVRETQPSIDASWRSLEYRPTASIVLLNTDRFDPKVLLLDSGKAPNNISFPQGGIEQGDTLVGTVFKELKEESEGLIKQAQVRILRRGNITQVPAEAGRKDKRGFTHGKEYYEVLARFLGDPELTFMSQEVIGTKWVRPLEVAAETSHISVAKREMMLKALKEFGLLDFRKYFYFFK